jgi:hypothetical protein
MFNDCNKATSLTVGSSLKPDLKAFFFVHMVVSKTWNAVSLGLDINKGNQAIWKDTQMLGIKHVGNHTQKINV